MKNQGFTLTELLVVIAILAILAALVFFGARKAVQTSDRAACLANLRQLSVAAHLFNQERNEFPSWQRWYFPSTSTNPDNRGFREYFTGTTAALPEGSREQTAATSPLVARKYPPESGANHTYAMNFRLSNHTSYGIKSRLAVESPSKMMHFMYGLAGNRNSRGTHFFTPFLYSLSGVGSLDAKGFEGQDRFYDDGYSSILYFDGHVGRISREKAEVIRANAAAPESRLFWRGVR
jgi:prepilin-type N-terminal cleavage/methylation domain-containing protein/prepilin-type processing-associated H-X9-DG protein